MTAGDFASGIATRLKPILAPAEEKADMLMSAVVETHGEPAPFQPRGLTPTIRRLAAHYGERAVVEATDALLARMAAWGSLRERVK